MRPRDVVPWVLACVLAVALVFDVTPVDDAFQAERERLEAASSAAEARATAAEAARDSAQDLLEAELREGAQVDSASRRAARQAVEDRDREAAALRATLDSLGAATAPLDGLLLAERLGREAQARQIASLERRVAATAAALVTADSLAAAQRARAEAAIAEKNLMALRLGIEMDRRQKAERDKKLVVGGAFVVLIVVAVR